MKYKKKLAKLQSRILFWEKAGGRFQQANKKPGAIK